MRITLLGTLTASGNERVADDATLAGHHPRLVFAMLACERDRPLNRHELADALWPDRLPRAWEAALRGVVAKVRGFLGGAGFDPKEVLRTEPAGYRLRLPEGTTVDVEEALEAIRAAEAELAGGSAERAAERAAEAATVLQRPFLVDVDAPWLDSKRAALCSSRALALNLEAEAWLTSGHARRATQAARRLVEDEPFHEPAHRLLMRALAAAGDRAGALVTYEHCRDLLASELGVAPDPATERLRHELSASCGASSPPAPGPAVPPRRDWPLVGRSAERALLETMWPRVTAGERPVVLITGEAGIGKTRLIHEMAVDWRERGAIVLPGQCDEEAVVPYQPLAEALSAAERQCPSDAFDELLGAAPELALLHPTLARHGHDPPRLDAGVARHRLLEAVATFLRDLSRSIPTVLVLDDVQWATAPTLLMLRHLIRGLRDHRVMCVVIARDTEPGASRAVFEWLAELRREPDVEEITLRGLSNEDTRSLVGAALTAMSPAEVERCADDLRARTAGNPFFVRELLGAVADRDHDWSLALRVVPVGVTGLLEHRRSRLDEPARAVLDTAAVMGTTFGLGVVQRAADLEPERFVEAFDALAAAGLISEAPGATGAFAFSHALARDAVYQSIPPARRARLHHQVALVLREVRRSGAQVPAAELARHFVASADLATVSEAVSHTLEAADEALRRLAYEEAVVILERALALECSRTHSLELLLELGHALQAAGRAESARLTFTEAAELARDLGNAAAGARAVLGMRASGGGVSGWYPTAEDVWTLEDALAAIGEEASPLRVELLGALAHALHQPQHRERRQLLARTAMETAREIGTQEVLASALSASRVALWGPANTDERLRYTDEVVVRAASPAKRDLRLQACLQRLVDLTELGERHMLDAGVREVEALAGELNHPLYRWQAATWKVTSALLDGRLDDGERLAAEALAVRDDANDPDALTTFGVELGVIRMLQGRFDDASAIAEAAVAAYPDVTGYRCVLPVVHARAGRVEEAVTLLDGIAESRYALVPQDSSWLFALACLSEACDAAGHERCARDLLEMLTPYTTRMILLTGPCLYWGSVEYQAGVLARVLGDVDTALGHLERAITAEHTFRARPWQARAQIELAATLLTRGHAGDREPALNLLLKGGAAARRMGMTWTTDRARALHQAAVSVAG